MWAQHDECNWWPLQSWHLQHLVLIRGSDLAQYLQKVPSLHYLSIVEFVTTVYLASLLKTTHFTNKESCRNVNGIKRGFIIYFSPLSGPAHHGVLGFAY